MASVWSYEGMRVVVSGGGGAGMGAATVTELANLGAEIHVLDLKDPPVDVASHQSVDLRDPDATAAAIAKIGGKVDALFNCAGLPGPPFSDLDTMLVNFVAMRHLAELCAAADVRRRRDREHLLDCRHRLPAEHRQVDAARDHQRVRRSARRGARRTPRRSPRATRPSKEAIIIWTMYAALGLAKQDVRVNCISPGPTDTPMMPAFEDFAGADLIDKFTEGLGRRSTPEEQAYPLIFLNSRAASYVSGENFVTDGGTVGAIMTGNISLDFSAEANLG